MPNPNSINFGPGQDKFGPQFYPKYNSAIGEIIETGALVGTNIVLTQYDSGTITIPLAPVLGGYSIANTFVNSAGVTNLPAPGAEQERIVSVVAGAAVTINLPAVPTANYRVTIKDTAGTASADPITINGTFGIDFGGTFVLNSNFESVSLIFLDNGLSSMWMRDDNFVLPGVAPGPTPPALTLISAPGITTLPAPAGETKRYVTCKTLAGNISIQLPAFPTAFYEVVIKDLQGNAATNPISITGAGGVRIDLQLSAFLINQNRGSLTFVYIVDGANSSYLIV